MASIIRLYLDHPMSASQSIALSADHAHYLFGVMRKGVGEVIHVFNGRDGAWAAEVVQAGKRKGTVVISEQVADQTDPPDLWLLFAPIKKARTDFIVEKAAEMGAARICPVQTDFTNAERIKRDRLQAHAVEAAEQCGGTFVPQVAGIAKLDQMLATWDPARQILFCDEALVGGETKLLDLPRGPWAILIGPEGGFSDAERDRLTGLPFAHSISLGPRVLRADTAAVAALTLWQSELGDWS